MSSIILNISHPKLMFCGHFWACLKADQWPQILALLFYKKIHVYMVYPYLCNALILGSYKNLQSMSYDQFCSKKHMREQFPWELELKTGTQIH